MLKKILDLQKIAAIFYIQNIYYLLTAPKGSGEFIMVPWPWKNRTNDKGHQGSIKIKRMKQDNYPLNK